MHVALAGGATVVQLREKNVSSAELLETAHRVHKLTLAAGVPLIINDRIDIALAVMAEGVHLGQSDLPLHIARKILGPKAIIGVSAKTIDQARAAAVGGADYLGVGAVYGTTTKKDAVSIGLDGFSKIRAVVDLPLVAIGGISHGERARDVMACGADGVAVVGAIFDTEDVEAATQRLVVDIAAARSFTR